jgi:hypothetical protein
MEHLKEKFLKIYANIPINLRDEIILVLDDGRPITWDVAYFEIKNSTELSQSMLKNLKELDLI